MPQLLQQRLDLAAGLRRVRLADQHVHALDVEVAELPSQLLARLGLDRVALVQQLQHRLLVGDVAEVGAEHRVERLRDQLLDVAEALDDARRLLVVDVDDHRQRQQRLVGVLGHQVDRAQAFVVAVRLGLAGDPVQHEVRRRHQDDVAGVGVERVLARAERPFPDAALALGHALAVAEGVAGEVAAGLAVVADDHADVADRHDRLGMISTVANQRLMK